MTQLDRGKGKPLSGMIKFQQNRLVGHNAPMGGGKKQVCAPDCEGFGLLHQRRLEVENEAANQASSNMGSDQPAEEKGATGNMAIRCPKVSLLSQRDNNTPLAWKSSRMGLASAREAQAIAQATPRLISVSDPALCLSSSSALQGVSEADLGIIS